MDVSAKFSKFLLIKTEHHRSQPDSPISILRKNERTYGGQCVCVLHRAKRIQSPSVLDLRTANFRHWNQHVHSTRQTPHQVQAHARGRRSASSPRLSASATLTTSTRSSSSTTFAMTSLRTTWPGFPWHPHRGIRDHHLRSGRNRRTWRQHGQPRAIAAGAAVDDRRQAASFTRRCPRRRYRRMHGFQLWANLPSALKMTTPRYQEVKTPTSRKSRRRRTHVRIVCGNSGASLPVDGIAADPIYLDVSVPPRKRKTLPVETHSPRPSPTFSRAPEKFWQRLRSARRAHRRRRLGRYQTSAEAEIVPWWVFDRGDEVAVQAGEDVSVSPRVRQTARRAVACVRPNLMNTQQQLQQAFRNSNRERS